MGEESFHSLANATLVYQKLPYLGPRRRERFQL